ncbi:MAG: polysaccharide biosynthesis/export family protein [Terriglobales bacterium]
MKNSVRMCLFACLLLCGLRPGQAQTPLHWLTPWRDTTPAHAAAASGKGRASATVAAGYRIGPGDVLRIDVWKEAEISQTEPVRPDGEITLPLVGAVRASGLTPAALGHQIETLLAAYIAHPQVTVMVDKVVSRAFQVLGSVLRPGSYPLVRPTHVLQALAEAGGFTPYADRSHLVVLHWNAAGQQERFRFNYSDIIHGHHLQQDRLLQPGDTLIVP